MEILVYIFSTIFIFLAMVMLFAFHRTRHPGLFLIAFTYGASAVLAIMLMQAWPLLVGFVFAWILRLMGMEPGPDRPEDKPPAE